MARSETAPLGPPTLARTVSGDSALTFVGRPCRARDVRQLRHLGRHLRRYVDTRGLAVVFGRIGNVSAERLQEDRNAVAPTNLLGDARIAVQRSVLARACVLIDLIQGRSRQQPALQRGQERVGIVLGDVADCSRLRRRVPAAWRFQPPPGTR